MDRAQSKSCLARAQVPEGYGLVGDMGGGRHAYANNEYACLNSVSFS